MSGIAGMCIMRFEGLDMVAQAKAAAAQAIVELSRTMLDTDAKQHE
jgi:hypothetical protein